jgi:hypothetical protein
MCVAVVASDLSSTAISISLRNSLAVTSCSSR